MSATESTPASEPGSPGFDARSVVLFDGGCNLCHAGVRFIIRHDPRGRFVFAPLGSDAAGKVLERAGCSGQELPDSMLVVEEGSVYSGSDAALRIARHLRFPWSVAWVLRFVPRAVRDRVYGLIARKRYRWFGKRNSCPAPTPEQRARFLNRD